MNKNLQSAWGEVCAKLQSFGNHALSTNTAIDRAEGVRHVLRYLAHLGDHYIEFADAAFPEFRKVASATRKFYGDCVDADYFSAALNPSHAYRIRGTIGNISHSSVIVYRKDIARRVAGNLSDEELGTTADGRFDIWLASTPQEGPGILLDERCNEVVVRHYFQDRRAQAAGELEIVRIGSEGETRGTLDEEWLAKALATCSRALEVAPQRLEGYRDSLLKDVNTLKDAQGSGMSQMFFGTTANKYLAGWFRLRPGESLHVTMPRVDAKYVGINLYNRWMESLEFRDRTVSLNHSQMHFDADGLARIVIGGRPRDRNWIDTCGRDEGSILVRFLETESDLPQVACEVRND